jgi:hypothetical protein
VSPRLPAELPDRLSAYLPGRIVVVPDDVWPARMCGRAFRSGIRTRIPRYALEVRIRRDAVDPAQVRRLVQGWTIRGLDSRPVELTNHRGVLWVLDGHTALAAHLAVGTEEIPVRLVSPMPDATRDGSQGSGAVGVAREPALDRRTPAGVAG